MASCPGILWRCSTALALLCACGGAHAEPLTYEEAVTLALERAPRIVAQRFVVEGAQASEIAAGRLPDPQLIAGIDNLPANGEEAWSLDRDFMTMQKVGVMQAFPNHRKREAERERAAAAVTLARTQSNELRLETLRAAADAWVVAQTAELTLAKLRELAPDIELQAQAAQAALATARGSAVDALTARSEQSAFADRILDAQREVAAARADLAQWIGEDASRPLPELRSFDKLPAPREELLASLHRHPTLLTFDAQRTLARTEIDMARADKRPDWSTELTYNRRGDAFSDMVSLEFRVGLPLFSGKRQDPQIAARRAELARLDAEREAELRTHTSEVRNALAVWDAARTRIDLYETERLPLARQRSRAALAGYRAGTADLASVLQSQLAEVELQLSYTQLLRDLARAWVFLRYLDGQGDAP